MSKEKCERIIKKNWKDLSKKQPEIWLRVNSENIQVVAKYYSLIDDPPFINKNSLNKQWISGNLLCTLQKEVAKNSKVIINCDR